MNEVPLASVYILLNLNRGRWRPKIHIYEQ